MSILKGVIRVNIYLKFTFVISRENVIVTFFTRRTGKRNVENYFLRNIASLGMQLEMIRGGTIILLDTVDRPISNWIIRISAAVVRGVVSIVQWLLLRRSVEKSFKKISFHAYKLRANGYNKDEGEEKMRERFPDCLPVSCVR